MTPRDSWIAVVSLVAVAGVLAYLWHVLTRWVDRALERDREVALLDIYRETWREVERARRSRMIELEHRGETYPVRDVWEAIEVSRLLAQIDRLPEAPAA